MPKRAKEARNSLRPYKLIRSGALNPFSSPDSCPLTGHSIHDALRNFIPPIKTDGPHVDFYTMYKREPAKYDMDYIKKYDEDLNTTLILVR